MAFCNSCGNSLADGAKFCSKCGAQAPGLSPSPAAMPGAPSASYAPQSNSALKTVLIVGGLLVGILILGSVMASIVAWHIARHTRVEQDGNNVRVVSPFGSVETSNDSADISRELGSAMYPGSNIQRGSASSVHIGSMHTVTAQFESDDPVSKVAEFYRSKFPDARVSVGNEDHYTIVSSSNNNLLTINIAPEGSKTAIHVSSVSGKHVTGSSSSD